MPDPLTDQLLQRQLPDPQSAWQHASSIGSDVPQTKDFTLSMMPAPPAEFETSNIMQRLKDLFKTRAAKAAEEVAMAKVLPKAKLPPEFTPVDGEADYNLTRATAPAGPGLIEQVYNRILQKGGR